MNDSQLIFAGSCAESEDLILTSFDQPLSESERQGVDKHLAGCGACRAFWNEQQKLDVALSASLQPASLPADFKNRMIARGRAQEAASASSSEARESELRATLADLQKESSERTLGTVLDGIGFVTLALLVVVGVYDLSDNLPELAKLSSQQLQLYSSGALGAASVVGALWIAFQPRLRLLLKWA